MPGLAYDDSGVLAAYFGITFLSFVLFPATFYTLRKFIVGDERSRAAKKECSCQECRRKVRAIQKAEAKSVFSKRYVDQSRSHGRGLTFIADSSPCSSDGSSSPASATSSPKARPLVHQSTTRSRSSASRPRATKHSSRNTLNASPSNSTRTRSSSRRIRQRRMPIRISST